ncbi:NosD domain-containing protein [Modestobacter sp. NPDC049651]|uniref:right-handed parallel beta-helix repeat-containing protein n=1 Tax=unclassified Modestobacter TaxID=2643866 RepID=UPI0033E870D5
MGRRLSVLSVLALLLAVLPAGVASAHWRGGHTWVVEPGQSIQAAVDQARSGDTIQLLEGTYENQAVCINGKGLTITGAGADKTRITWPDWTVVEDQAPAPAAGNACWTEWARHDPESTDTAEGDALQQSLSDDVSALFFFNPDSPVTVTGLQTVNHPANGIVVETARDVQVSHTKGVAHDRYGILVSNTTNSRITDNVEQGLDRGIQQEGTSGSSGTAGISVSDSPTANSYVARNSSDGWNLGIFVRESRTGKLVGNTVTNNCVGINMFDDGNTEVPVVAPSTIPAGDWRVVGNTVRDNHRFCLAGIGQVEGQLAVSGTGVAVVNMDSVLIKGNTITDNGPTPPARTLDFPAAGLLLLTLPLFNTDQPNAAGPVENVSVVKNTIDGNTTSVDTDGPGPAEPFFAPLDVLVGFPPGTVFTDADGNVVPTPVPGPGINFSGNSCGVALLGEGVSGIDIGCGGA